MPVETEADRRLFMQEDDFAVPVSWNRAGVVSTFPALFDDTYALIDAPFIEAGVEGSSPQIHCCTADLPPDRVQGDTVTVDGKAYQAVEFKPDGTGMTIVRLRET